MLPAKREATTISSRSQICVFCDNGLFHVEQGAGAVAGLANAVGEIAGGGLEPGRSTGFEAEKAESEALQGGGKLVYRGAAVAGALGALFTDPDAPAERRTSGNDDGLSSETTMAGGEESSWFVVRGSWFVVERVWEPVCRTRRGW